MGHTRNTRKKTRNGAAKVQPLTLSLLLRREGPVLMPGVGFVRTWLVCRDTVEELMKDSFVARCADAGQTGLGRDRRSLVRATKPSHPSLALLRPRSTF